MNPFDSPQRIDRRRALVRIALALAAVAALVALAAGPVAADSEPGGGESLGLDAVRVTSATVDPRSGLVTISGEIECSQDIEEVHIDAGAEQLVGRLNVIQGSGDTSVGCPAEAGGSAWVVSFHGWDGKFAPGVARVSASAWTFVCTEEECFEDFVESGPLSLRLHRG
jgi:hypothetical protein